MKQLTLFPAMALIAVAFLAPIAAAQTQFAAVTAREGPDTTFALSVQIP